jgi:VanZ family protein
MAVIYVLSGMPDIGPLPAGVSDLTAHFVGYALLGVLVLRAVAGARWSGVSWSAAGRAWLISAIYGVTDEFHQSFVDTRTPSAADWSADAAGAAVAIAAVVLVAAIVRREKGREV